MKARRLECNLTQETTYLSARVDRRTLQALELGQGNPTYETLLRLSHVLDIPLADLVR
ncbi:helix-turn-helix transcriptional regulator [Streptomyces sp. NPDC050535]|uniref:helix-turn-helix transcriptional regulator n=1 Tax=Streptomyces sp. NPDC050535 TaxID=3365626 RepID=UPI00379773E2